MKGLSLIDQETHELSYNVENVVAYLKAVKNAFTIAGTKNGKSHGCGNTAMS